MTDFARIPTLDLRDFQSGDPTRKKVFVTELQRAFEDTGFVVIRGHQVSPELQAEAYAKIDAFFKLPTDTKRYYEIEGIGGARGYTTFGKEHAKDSKVGDLKEFFHVGMELPKEHAYENSKDYPPNVSVKEIPGFDATLRQLYNGLLFTGIDLLKAIALIFDLPENWFTEQVRYGNSILRPIHYPPLTGREPPGAVRSGAHEDINLITLLIGASSPGLQVKLISGDWYPVTTQASEIVVNVGDMLQRLTNHRFKSTTHRVVNPPPDRPEQARYSIPFFLHPISEMSLAALPSCVPSGQEPKEGPISAGQYLHQRLVEIGLL